MADVESPELAAVRVDALTPPAVMTGRVITAEPMPTLTTSSPSPQVMVLRALTVPPMPAVELPMLGSVSVDGGDVIADIADTGPAISLMSPGAGQTVLTTRPQFVVSVGDDDVNTYTVEIQHATNEALTGATTLTATAPPAGGGVTLKAAQALSGTIWWRARLTLDGQQVTGWTDKRQFTIQSDYLAGAAGISVTWTVGAAARPIHLWHILPPGGSPGDKVTVYGYGFPDSPGSITIAGATANVISWQRVAASSAGPSSRVINGHTIDAEHFKVVITVPPVDEPGGPLVVEG